MSDTIDLTISLRGEAEDKQAEFAIHGGKRVRIELGRVYLIQTVHSVGYGETKFPYGTAFALTGVREARFGDYHYVDTARIAVGGKTIETGWLDCRDITEIIPA